MPASVLNYINVNLGIVWLRCDGSAIPAGPDFTRLKAALSPNLYVPNYTGKAAPAQPIADQGGNIETMIMVIKT